MKQQPTLQAAVATGLTLLADPDVRVPASQAEGIAALRMLLQGLAAGQLVISEPTEATKPMPPEPKPEPKPKTPRRTKAQMIAARAQANGAAAAPVTTQ